MMAGLHDAAFSKLSDAHGAVAVDHWKLLFRLVLRCAPPDRNCFAPWYCFPPLALTAPSGSGARRRAGFSRVVWMLPSAVHRHQPWQSNCSQMSQILRPTCMQWSQLHLSNVRIQLVAARVRAALAEARRDFPGAPRVELVDAFAVTGAGYLCV
jgi:hypothetical protein